MEYSSEILHEDSFPCAHCDPPPYKEVERIRPDPDSEKLGGYLGQWDFKHEIHASRAERVIAIVKELSTTLKRRAEAGLSKTTFVLIPSEQGIIAVETKNGTLVELEEERPLIVLLRGRPDSVEFWVQPQAVQELLFQMNSLLRSSGQGKEPAPAEAAKQPENQTPARSGFFHRRRRSTVSKPTATSKPAPKAPALVEQREVHLRKNTDVGLIQTLAIQAVVVRIDL